MKKLESEFEGKGEVKGFYFRKLMESPKAYLYEVNDGCHFEVFKVRVQQESDFMIGGQAVHLEEKELYPNSEQFGLTAWCYLKYANALKKFNRIK